MIYKRLFSILLLISGSLSYCLPYSIDSWKSKRGNSIHFINDAHIDTALEGVIEANKEEADYLRAYINNNAILTVTENAFEYPQIQNLSSDLQAAIKTYLEPHFEKAQLKQFIHLLKENKNNSFFNVEHRQFRSHGNKDERAYELDRALVNAVIEEINTYSDNALLNNYYKKITDEVIKIDPKQLIGTNANYYDSQLIDARILHIIYQQQCAQQNWFLDWFYYFKNLLFSSSNDLIITVGGSHSKRIQEFLPLLEYEKIASHGKECISLPTAAISQQELINNGYTFIDTKNQVAVSQLSLNTIFA